MTNRKLEISAATVEVLEAEPRGTLVGGSEVDEYSGSITAGIPDRAFARGIVPSPRGAKSLSIMVTNPYGYLITWRIRLH